MRESRWTNGRPARRRALASPLALLALGSTLALSACGGSDNGPLGVRDAQSIATLAARNDSLELAMAAVAGATRGAAGDSASVRTPPVRDLEFAQWPFPASLELTDRQKAQIRALRQAHADAIASDLAAMKRIAEEARAAKAAGKPAAEIERILAQGKPIAERLASAERRLTTAIEDVFTPEQKRWLAQFRACLRAATPTDAQRREIAALHERFRSANAADLKTVEDALARIAAVRADKSLSQRAREERIAAILESVRPARERLAAAYKALEAAIARIVPRRDCTNP
jgi:LTXXQ motif family protein